MPGCLLEGYEFESKVSARANTVMQNLHKSKEFCNLNMNA